MSWNHPPVNYGKKNSRLRILNKYNDSFLTWPIFWNRLNFQPRNPQFFSQVPWPSALSTDCAEETTKITSLYIMHSVNDAVYVHCQHLSWVFWNNLLDLLEGYSSGVDITLNPNSLSVWFSEAKFTEKLQAKTVDVIEKRVQWFLESEDSDSAFWELDRISTLTCGWLWHIIWHIIWHISHIDINDMTINGMHSSVSVMWV